VKVAYISKRDHSDISQWSGTVHYMDRSLVGSGLHLNYVSGYRSAWELVFLAKTALYRKVLKRPYARHYQPAVLRSYARQIEGTLDQIKPDVIFTPDATSIAYLQTDIPIVFWTDSTFAGVQGFYHQLTNLSAADIRRANLVEQQAISNCCLAIYCSAWAAQTALDNYNVDPSKVKVVPFGANIDCNRTVVDIKQIISNRDTAVCKLLFVGVDWLRKGGDIAVAVATALNANGLPTELHVVGCTPPSPTPHFVKLHGFVSKQSHDGRMLLNNLFTQSHFFILPTRAECFGVVFAEASSFGLPSLATRVGGVPTAVIDNMNGKTFAIDGIVEYMTDYILETIADNVTYNDLCMRSFTEYCNRLNWVTVGNTVNQLIHELDPR